MHTSSAILRQQPRISSRSASGHASSAGTAQKAASANTTRLVEPARQGWCPGRSGVASMGLTTTASSRCSATRMHPLPTGFQWPQLSCLFMHTGVLGSHAPAEDTVHDIANQGQQWRACKLPYQSSVTAREGCWQAQGRCRTGCSSKSIAGCQRHSQFLRTRSTSRQRCCCLRQCST